MDKAPLLVVYKECWQDNQDLLADRNAGNGQAAVELERNVVPTGVLSYLRRQMWIQKRKQKYNPMSAGECRSAVMSWGMLMCGLSSTF